MEYTVTRNRTYHALDVEGRYKNIRIVYRPTTALPDGQEVSELSTSFLFPCLRRFKFYCPMQI